MKRNFYFERLLNFDNFLTLMIFCCIASQESLAQSNTTKWPQSDKIHSKRARVIIMNGDSSASPNENFYVTWGKHNHWFSQGIRLEVQKERGIGARGGMFMDTSHLYLVGDWDNNSTSEDIIFGFNSNLRSNVDEKMRLTEKGLLGLGTKSPKGKLNGNIGIGTGSPQAKLDVRGNTTIIGSTKIDGDTNINGNTSIKGDLTLSNPDRSQEFLINKGLDIRLTNIPNSHFSIQNAFGVDALYIDTKGKIAIGELSNSELTEQLHLGGRIKARGFIADASSFPDYVFNKNYDLTPIEEVKTYTEIHHSLLGMPTEKEVIKNGLDLKKITTISVEKIEELYLYTFKQQKLIKRQQAKINELNTARISQQKLIQNLQDRLEKLERPK